jgi:maltooligosyltrehalose trehalohydrolase
VILSPQIPLLFMGEEWAAKQPFMFFSDMGDDLADAIREARREELKDAPGPDDPGRTAPDPMARETFTACKLAWEDRAEDEECRRQLSLYKRLIGIRQKEIVPRLEGAPGNSGHSEIIGDKAIRVWWTLADGCELSFIANLSAEPLDNVQVWDSDHLWIEGFATGHTLEAWSAVFRLTKPRELP